MRRLALALLATTSLVALTQGATAADLGPMIRKAPAAVMPAYYNWTGCYIGGHVGYGWGQKDVPGGEFETEVYDGFGVDVDGFLGGVQAGCNYQVSPRWVIGAEGQFSWTDIDGSYFRDGFLSGKASEARVSAQVDWVATLAARLGFTWDRWMIYGKGGIAWARDKYGIAGFIDTEGAGPFAASAKETRVGWMVGVGLEYAFGNNWSAKAEYNYMDFGDERVTLRGLIDGVEPITLTTDIDQQLHVVKFGLNYRFGPMAGPAVSSRY